LMRGWPGDDLKPGSVSCTGCCVLVADVADSTVGSAGGVHHA
jgi:coenzyme F420-reducing hydrogenase beta subunit